MSLEARRILVGYMIINGPTDVVDAAAGLSMAVATPTIAWNIEISDNIGDEFPDATTEIVAKVHDTAAAPRHTVVDSSVAGAGQFRVSSADLAGAAAAAAGKVTISVFRVLTT